MPTKYIENTGRTPIFVGGKLIPPNEGRDIDAALLPPERRAMPTTEGESQAPSLADLVAQLQAKTVKVIAEELPLLTHEGLDLLAEAENAGGKPRAGVLAAIDAERLRRANERLQAENNAQDDAAYAEQLANLTAEQRAALGEPPQA